jgi:hypothetical protein
VKTTYRVLCTVVMSLVVTSLLSAADPDFAGTWKLNLSKSQLGGTVYTFERKGHIQVPRYPQREFSQLGFGRHNAGRQVRATDID